MTPRAVFDCMVFLQAAARPDGPAGACLRQVEEGKVILCISPPIMAEVRDVLSRPKTQKKFPLLTTESVEEFVKNVESKAVAIDEVPKAVTFERDLKDEPYLNLAIATGSQYLVSRDKDLLDLMNDKEHCERFPALTILDPVAFLQIMAQAPNPS